jgi:hypothetical protein
MVAILENSAMTNKTFHRGLGIEFGHGEYTSRAFGYVANDRIHLTSFDGYGIHYYVIAHTIERDKTWWTLMISLWYPIVFFGILPSVFLAKKLRGRKLALTPKKEPHERP